MQVAANKVRLEEDVARIVESISYVIFLHEKRKHAPTQYDIVKSIFLADRSHLNKYGRPVTYDNYSAMKHGPVPSLTYNLLKNDRYCFRRLGLSESDMPWVITGTDGNKNYFHIEHYDFNEDLLSESDAEELEAAVNIVGSLSFGQLRRLTHEDPAYVEAWKEGGTAKSYPIDFALLFESPNRSAAARVEFLSKHQ